VEPDSAYGLHERYQESVMSLAVGSLTKKKITLYHCALRAFFEFACHQGNSFATRH
jgi:hypothetical protein